MLGCRYVINKNLSRESRDGCQWDLNTLLWQVQAHRTPQPETIYLL